MLRTSIFITALLAGFGASAQGVNVQALGACAMVENDVKRLACYDKVMAGKPLLNDTPKAAEPPTEPTKELAFTPAPEKAEAPTQAAAPVKTPAPKAENDFGLEHKQATNKNGDAVTAKVVAVKEAPRGEKILTLDSEQVWRQIGTDRFRVSAGDKVVIERGFWNSFLLKKVDSNRSIRVKRVQ